MIQTSFVDLFVTRKAIYCVRDHNANHSPEKIPPQKSIFQGKRKKNTLLSLTERTLERKVFYK
jgi:hypothetical protein